MQDAGSMAELMSLGWPEPRGEASVVRALTAPSADPDRNARLALSQSGSIVGTAMLDEIGDGKGKFWLDIRAADQDAAEALVDWAESRCKERVEASARVFAGAWSAGDAVTAALRTRDFQRVRHSLRMTIDVSHEVPAPDWPDGISVRTLELGDERAVYEAHMETFADSWEHERMDYPEWSHWHLDATRYDPVLSFLAFAGDELAGISLCREDDVLAGVGWVSILGVRRAWRRRGLAAALLRCSFRAFADRDCRRVVLGVDGTSLTGAERLYERVGMAVADRFEIYEKTL
jgi:mycothiol synthase